MKRAIAGLVAAVLGLSTLAGCATTAGPAAPTAASPVAVPAVTSAPNSAAYGTSEPTERGSIPKSVGQHAAATDNQIGQVVVDFVVDAITPATCNSGADKPQNGRFIALNMTVLTKNDPGRLLSGLTFSGPWEFVDTATGRSYQASTTAAASCHYDATRLGPNRTYQTTAVLDVPEGTTGVVIINPYQDGGWEWAVSA